MTSVFYEHFECSLLPGIGLDICKMEPYILPVDSQFDICAIVFLKVHVQNLIMPIQ